VIGFGKMGLLHSGILNLLAPGAVKAVADKSILLTFGASRLIKSARAALVAAGGAYTLYLFAKWVESGYRYLPLRGENALALALIVLGAQAAATAMAAHLVGSGHGNC
jgi:branched-subunit amino acid ABC-type transport system permease component